MGSGNLFANLYPQAAEQENVLHKSLQTEASIGTSHFTISAAAKGNSIFLRTILPTSLSSYLAFTSTDNHNLTLAGLLLSLCAAVSIQI